MNCYLLISYFVALLLALWCAARAHPKLLSRWRIVARPWMYFTLLGAALGLMALAANGAGCEGPAVAMAAVGAVLAPGEFQEQVLDGVRSLSGRIEEIGEETQAVATKQETLLSNYDNLEKRTKGIMEDVTRSKKWANDTQGKFDEFLRKLKLFELQMRNEVRQAHGDPIKRIQRDEELCRRFNAICAQAILKHGQELPEWHQKALGEDSSPGSTMVDDRLAQEIYDTLSTFGVWPTFAVRRLSTKQTKFPVKTARPVANFILTEAATIADDTAKAGTSVTLEVELIAVLLNVSIQLLEDSEFDVTADVLSDFAEAYALRLDTAALTATGAADATNGGMTGVFEGGTLVAAGATEDTVEELDLEDFISCLTAVDPIVLARMAKWWTHPQMLVRALAIKDADGRPIFQTALEAPAHGAIGTILGYPVVLAFAAPSTNTANTKVFTFGDPNGQVVGVRTDFRFEGSDHHRWNTYERSFRGVGRAGTKIRRSQAFANLRLTT